MSKLVFRNKLSLDITHIILNTQNSVSIRVKVYTVILNLKKTVGGPSVSGELLFYLEN